MGAPAGSWPELAAPPVLGEGEIHVWRIDLALSDAAVGRALEILDADERRRAERFHFPRHRRRLVASHAAVRDLLGGYLDADPGELELVAGESGKPRLAGRWGERGLRFNLSHTGDLALAAVATGIELGVDVETLRPLDDLEALARRAFSPAEQQALFALPPAHRRDAFFACWCRKEAYVKARGDGLWGSLKSFDVSLEPGAPARLLATRPDPAEAGRWAMWAVDPGPGLAGALVAEGGGRRLRAATYAGAFAPDRPGGAPG